MDPGSTEDIARFYSIVTSSQDAILTKTIDGTITSWNPAAERIFGYSKDEIIGKNVNAIVPEELMKEEKEIIQRVRKGEKIEHYRTVRKTKTGERILIALTVSPIKDPKGKVVEVSTIARDITDERTSEEKQAMLASIVSSSDDAIVSKTLDGIITSWNRGAENIFGYKEKEAIGKHISLIIPSDRLHEETVIINKIRSGGRITHFDTIRVAKDGKRINISLTVSPMKDANGKVIGASKIARDITDRVEAEKQRQLYTERLKELNKYKDEFMAMASHELKTPLTVIKANLQILEHKMKENGNLDFVKKTLRSVNKLSDLITDLLDVSKIQSGKLELNPVVFDLRTLLKEAVENIQQTTSTHHIRCGECEEELLVNADKERIEQVIVNLFTNAIKYSPESDFITVGAHKEDNRIIVSIKDSGIGIPEADLENIFSRFYRVRGMAATFAGSGIGLYISSEIIKRHNGEMWAESEEGKGSTFYFTLPADKGTLSAPPGGGN